MRAARPRDIADTVAGFLKAGDLEGVVSMFHPDCKIFFPAGEPPKLGHEGARQAFASFLPRRPTLISRVTSEVIVGDTALLKAEWRFEDGAAGNVIAEGSSTEVAKQMGHGGWVYMIDCPFGAPDL